MSWDDKTTKIYNLLEPNEKQLFSKTSSRFFKTFTQNLWQWDSKLELEEADDLSLYFGTVLANYDCTIYCKVASHFHQLGICGKLGILWLEVKYEYADRPFSVADLNDMLWGIRYAEQNLVKLGIPFVDDYRFHQETKTENDKLAKLNAKNVKEWKLKELAELRDNACDKFNSQQK